MADYVSTTFPHTELTVLADSRPTFLSLQRLHAEIQSNAESVPSIRGNGELGHLSLTISAAQYLIESNGVAFNPPIHPGAAPNHPDGATGPVITEINRQFLADQKEFQTYTNVAGTLKRQVLQAVPELYLEELRHPTRNFSRLTVLAILDHLDSTYGTITTDDLAANRKNLHREWSSAQPLESLWTNITRCRHVAQALDPISDMEAVQAALDNLDRTGVFIDAVKLWRLRPSAERTLANMKAHFTLADLERQRELTAKSAGYHGAALATAPNVTAPVTTPTLKYCWTHGFGVNSLGHHSQDCTRQAPGHRTEATMFDMLGGNNTARRKRNERAVYKPRDFTAAVAPAPFPPAPVAATTQEA